MRGGYVRSTVRWLVPLVGLVVAAGVLAMSRPDAPQRRSAPPPVRPELGGLRFTEVTADSGLTLPYAVDQRGGDQDMSSPLLVADLVGSPAPDLYVSRRGSPNSLYQNDGTGRFVDVAAQAGVTGPDPTVGSGPGSAADFDGDGCTDLYVAALGTGRDALYRSDCHGRFDDVTATSGIAFPPADDRLGGAHHHGVATADVDLDGDLDLLVASWDVSAFATTTGRGASVCDDSDRTAPSPETNRSRLFLNDGRGRFTDVTAPWGLRLAAVAAFTPVFADVDEDGWADLLVTGDGCTSRLYRNDGGRRFVDITSGAGVGTDENGMGSVVRDIDGDGHLDWFVSSISAPTEAGRCPAVSPLTGCSGNRLYLGDGTGRFHDATDRFGLRDGGWGWGAVWEDFAGTGRPQLLQVNGYRPSGAPKAGPEGRYFDRFDDDATRFWAADGRGRYGDAARAVGLDARGIDHAVVAADLDDDGDLDVVTAGSDRTPRVWRNDRPPGRRWLTVRLDDVHHPGNRAGVGAKVVATVDRDRRTTDWISTNGSYESQQLPEVHLTLDPTQRSTQVEVTWPGTQTSTVLADVAVDQVLVIRRASAN